MACEVRVPTYKRPDLLDRALKSLIEQTYTDWIALIFDDSPSQEGASVVEKFKDSRLIYKPHHQNLGCSKNIDHCFYSKSYLGATYAFILEDDNYLFPEFIERNIQSLEKNDVNILLRNQEMRMEKDGNSIPMNKTTRGKWFNQGKYTPLELYSRLFFCEGISNGGLFWNTEKIISDLQIGSKVENSWHQELFRTLSINENIYFEEVPMCVFTEFEKYVKPFSCAPKHNRGTQSILIYLVKKYGSEIVEIAQQIAVSRNEESLLEKKLLNALYTDYSFTKTSHLSRIRFFLKYLIRYSLYKDPFKQVLSA